MSGTVLNVFDQDAFTSVSLTAAVERNPYPPSGLGKLHLFEEDFLYTQDFMVEQEKGQLMVLPMQERGEPPTQLPSKADKREARYFRCPMIAHEAKVTALEVMGVRETGTIARMRTMQQLLGKRLNGPSGLQANLEYTMERHRLAAVQGMLLDAVPANAAPGTAPAVKYNWFEQFGIAQPAPINFPLSNLAGSAVPTGKFRTACNETVRKMARASQGAFSDRTKVIGLCSDEFWDALIINNDVTSTYFNWLAAAQLREGSAFRGMADANPMLAETYTTPLYFGGIYWINYRGSDDLTSIALKPGTCALFPQGAAGVFSVAYAPHDSEEWVNKRANKKYIVPLIDRERQRWRKFELYSYPLHICTRPEVLFSGVAT